MRITLSKCCTMSLLAATMLVAGALIATPVHAQAAGAKKPNIVVIFMDDMGYADVGCFGAQGCCCAVGLADEHRAHGLG